MKINELIQKLQKFESEFGDIEVTVHSDQENNPEGQPTDPHICTITWYSEEGKPPSSIMLCDRFTYGELS